MIRGGVISRREALAMAGAFVVTAGCNPQKLFGPRCDKRADDAPRLPADAPALRDVYVVNDFTGLQLGTKENPYRVRTALEFDALMRSHQSDDALAFHLAGSFPTRGSYEWGDRSLLGWRAGKFWTFDGAGEIWIDPNAIADDEVDDAPLRCITTREQLSWGNPDALTAEQVWAGLPRGQTVRGLTLTGSHSALADRWKAKGKSLRTSGCLLQGHNAAIEGVRFKNFGALKSGPANYAETFPAVISGAMGAIDRNKIAQLDPATHVYDATGEPSHITGCTFDGFDPSHSDDQVTVFTIIGSAGEPGGWQTGNWKQTMRADCYQEHNTTDASGANLVQAHTIYQSLKGRVRYNTARAVAMGYYGDYYATKGVLIEENDFDAINHGVALYLSPTAADAPTLAEQFSHEDYTIGWNRITSKGANVSLGTLGPSTERRFIRHISVDPRLSLENDGATDVTRPACVAA